MTDLEKYTNQEKYPYEVEVRTKAFIDFLKHVNIELIIIDSPCIDEGCVETDRSLTYEFLINLIQKKINKGYTKLYFYNLTYKFEKLCNGKDEFIYSDTFYVRWLFKK